MKQWLTVPVLIPRWIYLLILMSLALSALSLALRLAASLLT